MKFYYAHQSKRWLTEEEQQGFHLDYEPQSTKELALSECRKFLVRGIKAYLDAIAWRIDAMMQLPPQ